MLMRRSSPPASLPLRVNDLLFLNEYLANGRNGTKAYQVAHPKCSYQSARKCASVLVAKPHIQAELAKRVQAEGITKQMVESNLLYALKLANDAKDAAVIASVTMDCAKLAGFLVERRQVEDVTEQRMDRSALVAELTQRGLVPSS